MSKINWVSVREKTSAAAMKTASALKKFASAHPKATWCTIGFMAGAFTVWVF